MSDFQITIVGSGDEGNVDILVETAKEYIKTLQASQFTIESASINSGHFLGGSRDLVEAAPLSTPINED